MIIHEIHSSSSYKYSYYFKEKQIRCTSNQSYSFSLKYKLKEIFLPQGYPESVSDDYMEYQMWDTIQALASTVTSTIANQAVLKGIGVGDETATLLGATLTWILKDGVGLVGRILFAYMKGTFLDCNCKRWRLFADILNDCAIFIDIFASHVPRPMFVTLICGASLCRSIVGVAGGATRAALTLHQARRNNMADVSAKDGSQESLSNLLGLMINLMVMSLVTGNSMLMMSAVVILTMIHLYSNFRAIKSVRMASFNQSRFHYVVQKWLATGDMASVYDGNNAEPVLGGLRRRFIRDLKIGCSIKEVPNRMSHKMISNANIFKNESYLLLLENSFQRRPNVFVLLKRGATFDDQLKASFHSEIIDFWLGVYYDTVASDVMSRPQSGKDRSFPDIDNIEVQSLAKCNSLIEEFKKAAQCAGWVFDPLLLGTDEWRIDF